MDQNSDHVNLNPRNGLPDLVATSWLDHDHNRPEEPVKTTLAIALLAIALPTAASTPTPAEVMETFDRLAEQPLWPGFDPSSSPVALFTGEETVLYRFPGTPEGFAPAPDGGPLVFPGRHPMILANTSTELDGHPLATVILTGSADRTADSLAALTIHELFHVYQRREHPSWTANEASLFSYPVADEKLYALRLLETDAMRRALAADSPAARDAWATEALHIRLDRFERMDEASAAYERDQELNEGLAQYVQDLALGADPADRFPERGWAPEEVRPRAYATGQFFATLLDAHLPAWKELYNSGLDASLDTALLIALAGEKVTPAQHDQEQLAAARTTAAERIASYELTLHDAERRLRDEAEWTVLVRVEEGANLLGLRGFDPLNVLALGDGKVLHTRMLLLASDGTAVEITDAEALSYGPNDHPLFQGVRWVLIATDDEPQVTAGNDGVRVTGPGFEVTAPSAALETDREERQLRVLLEP